MLLRKKLETLIMLLLLALLTYKPSGKEFQTWKKMLCKTLVASADLNLNQIPSAQQNSLIFKAKR